MGTIRIINTDLWVDPLIQRDFTPEDKLFWVYILTCPRTTQLGIYQITAQQIAFDLGYSDDTAENLISRFQEYHKRILYDYQNSELAILNFLRWSIVKGGKPVEDCLKADLGKVKNKGMVLAIYNHLLEHMNENQKPFNKTILQILKDYLNDYDNDNDNERIVPRFVNGVDIFKNYAKDDAQLLDAMKEFEKMRKVIKKPMTDKAKYLLCSELDKLKATGENIIDCINQSVLHNWQSVYAVKRGEKGGNNQQSTKSNENGGWNIKPAVKV